jgi:uncharacterized protein
MSEGTTEADVEVRDNPQAHRFEIYLGGDLAGVAVYEERPGALAIMHTEIDPAFEGHGLGSVLIEGALEATKKRGLALLPYCPFVNAYLTRHPEYVPLVPADLRGKFGLPPAE